MRKKHIFIIIALGENEVHYWNDLNSDLLKHGFIPVFLVYKLWKGLNKKQIQFKYLYLKHIAVAERIILKFLKIENRIYFRHINVLWPILKKRFNPQLVILWNGLNDIWKFWRYLLENESGIELLIAEKAGFFNMYQIEEKGINGLSMLLDKNYYNKIRPHQFGANEKNKLNKIIAHFKNSNKSNKEQKTFAYDKEKLRKLKNKNVRIISYFGIWDDAAGLNDRDPEISKAQSPVFKSSLDAAVEIAKHVDAANNQVLIIKQHPDNKYDWQFLTKRYKNTYILNNIDALDLIKDSDIIASISSSLTFIAAIHAKPIILMGRNPLYNKGYTYDINKKSDVKLLINEILMASNHHERLIKLDAFLYCYFTQFCFTSNKQLISFGVQSSHQANNKLITDRLLSD